MISVVEIDSSFRNKSVAEIIDPPSIIRVNKFDAAAVESFSKGIAAGHQTKQPVIPVVIDTYGGEVYGLMAMISYIQQSKKPIATIVEGKAMSAGGILLGMGTPGYRFVAQDATLLLHDIFSGGIGKVEELKTDAKQTDKLNKKIFRLLAKNCRQDQNFFLKMIHDKSHADLYLSAKECIKYKLADYIGMPSYRIKANVEFVFER